MIVIIHDVVYAVYTGEYEDTRIVGYLYSNRQAAKKAIEAYKEKDKQQHAKFLERTAKRYAKTRIDRYHPDNNPYIPEDYWIESFGVRHTHE